MPGARTTDRLSVPSDLKVVSYFPADAGWTEMWTDWHPDEIAKDLDRVVALHANTVRAVIEPDTFGWPDVQPVYAARLQQFVSMAGDRGLHVQLTLFDWWYRRPWVRASKQWARELLTPYIGDPRVAFLEVRNEILPKPETDKWAKKMIPFLRALLPGTPVTLSVAGLDPVARLALLKRGLGAVQPNFWDIHYFGGGGGANAYAVFAAAKAIAGSTPLWVGETGYPTVTDSGGYAGIPWTRASQEAAQSHFLASVAWAARADGLAPAGVWVLDDLVPSAVPDRKVGGEDPDLHYGLFRVDGSPKPAAAIVRASFDDGTPLGFNNSFEDAVPGDSGIAVPAQWQTHGTQVVFTDDPSVAAGGSSSARMAPYGAGSGSFSIVPPDGGVREGVDVHVEASAQRSDPNGRVFLVVEWHDRAGHRLRRDASEPLGPDATTWTQLSVTGTAPRDAAYARVDLVANGITAPVWLDDVRSLARRAFGLVMDARPFKTRLGVRPRPLVYVRGPVPVIVGRSSEPAVTDTAWCQTQVFVVT